MAHVLEVDDLSASYRRGTVVISDISFDVDSGSVSTILGANGAGKTTLLRSIAGQLQSRTGRIDFEGRPLGRARTPERVARGLVLVPQGHQVFGGLSIFENLKMGAFRRRGDSDLDASLGAVYELFPALEDRRDRLASSLSGGERAMLAIGRGLMSKPRLLLLDEPSLGLAPKARQAMFETLAMVAQQTQMTILMAEQDVALALSVSDYAYVLQGGRIVHHAAADDALLTGDGLRGAYLGV